MKLKILVFVLAVFLLVSPILNDKKIVQNANAQTQGMFTILLDLCFSTVNFLNQCIYLFVPILAAIVQGIGMIISAFVAVAPEFFTGFLGGFLAVIIPGYLCLSCTPLPLSLISCLNIALISLGIIPPPFLVIDIRLWETLCLECIPASLLGFIVGIINWTRVSPAEGMGINTGRIVREGQTIIQIGGEGTITQPRGG